ncbi:aromatic ring-hydroxylating dioxygenase subunit alpha [Paenibacillus sp. UNC451MF]|uniref:aromatic ring-hydroxylating dioxygenase subunit alpha n=1 Tax=Paenibacillus sp. UNC451MF TaxID=1449063 RepID=UPI00056D84BA|nr:aromatic ring-hydroxylating dioxygenase subunit alpha [Paenibacillus sp. UNC451MF]
MVDEHYRIARKEDHEVFPCTWYAIGWARELKDKPIKKRLLGRDLVLFRDQQGTAHALHAYCPHRGADLSLGRCDGGLLECAYHAWSFDGTGKCLDIPAHPGRTIPAFANTKSYPLIESIGLLWIYPMTRDQLESEPEPLKLINPVLENQDYVMAPYDTVWQAHLTRVVESVLDVAHVPIVHNKTIGKKSPKEITIEFEADDNHIRIRNGGGILHYDFPQQWLLTPVKTEGSQFINFVTFTPIEQEVTAIYGLAGRNFAKFPGMNYVFSRYSSKVLKEDQGIVESQHPRPIPDALRMEAHVPADGPQVRFRQRWYQFLTSDEPRIVVSEAKA